MKFQKESINDYFTHIGESTTNNIDDTCNNKKPRTFEELVAADPLLAVKIGCGENFQRFIVGKKIIVFGQANRCVNCTHR